VKVPALVAVAAAEWAEAVRVDLALVVTSAALVEAVLVAIAMVVDMAATAAVAVDGAGPQQLTAAGVLAAMAVASAVEAAATATRRDQARPLGGKEGAAFIVSSG